jgi:4-amino-4-deoxy-L-arabinose transferase-like glycosyltransferase
MFGRFATSFVAPRRAAVLAVLWLAGFAWVRPLAVPDEGRYTDIARWMVLSGDWLIPRLNGLPFIQKPPLYFWLEALGMGVAGTHVLVARWVSLAAALVTAYAVHRFVRARFDTAAARWSTIVLLTSPLFFACAQFASLDMLVSTCITCTVLFAIEAAEAPADDGRRLWLAAYATAALGVLAKGLIGIVIPSLVFSLWAISTRRPRLLLDAIQLRGLILLALITVPWFLLVESRVPGFLRYFFIHNHFERYAQTGFNNPRGAWFFFALVFGGMLPWTLALFHASRSALARGGAARVAALLGLIWSITVIVFFTIPTSKLAGYILPALPPLAIVLGPWCATWKYRRPAAIVAALLCVALVPFALRAKGLDPGGLASAVRTQVQSEDRVVFWGRYFFSVPVILQRTRPVEVVDAWATPSAQLPDSWRRELAEGRDFEPARAAGVLLTPGEFQESMTRDPGRVWVWAHEDDTKAPQLAGFATVLRRGEYVVLQRVLP